jgi:putative spermidine/putrescine transport system ATP-binding protein
VKANAPAVATALSIEKVSVRYGDVGVLDAVSLRIEPGEFLTLLGPSGSGKTSLLMAIAGFVDIAEGSIRFGDTELSALPPHRRNLGVVFQSYALFPHMNVFENVAYPLRLRKVPLSQVQERVGKALALVQMEQFASRGVHELSGGQRQRVAMARALVFEPTIMLMDEPLSALDRKLREHMQIELRRLHERLGITTVYVTHDQREALTMSDRIAVMNRGRLIQLDSPRMIYERPRTRFVADFIGISSFIPVTLRSGQAWFGRLAFSLRGSPCPDMIEEGAARLLALRPESLYLLSSHESNLNTLPANLRSAVYEGEAVFVEAEVDGSVVLRARVPIVDAEHLPPPGSKILLGWRPEASMLVRDEQA